MVIRTLAEDGVGKTRDYTPAVQTVIVATRTRPVRVTWERVVQYAVEARGIPRAISD